MTDKWSFVHGMSSPCFARGINVPQIFGSNSELGDTVGFIGQHNGIGKGSTPDKVDQLLGFVTQRRGTPQFCSR